MPPRFAALALHMAGKNRAPQPKSDGHTRSGAQHEANQDHADGDDVRVLSLRGIYAAGSSAYGIGGLTALASAPTRLPALTPVGSVIAQPHPPFLQVAVPVPEPPPRIS